MKNNPSLLIVILLIMNVLISAYALRKIYQAEGRATQSEIRVTQFERLAIRADRRTHQADAVIRMLRLAKIVEKTINRSGEKVQNDFQKAVEIRNTIHHQVPLKSTPAKFSFMTVDDSYLNSLREEEVGHLCGGLAAVYATALESQGIPSRYVGNFSRDKQPFESHATIEFWFQGKWYASDPTFNVMFRYQGDYLSYAELYALIKKGEPYEVVSNGREILPGRALEDYYVELVDLMNYMVVHPSEVWAEGEKFSYPMQLFPGTWDGEITYEEDQRRDVKNFGGIYKFLYSGFLR